MIPYSPGYWACCLGFRLRGSILPKAFLCAFPAGVAAFLSHFYFHHHFEDWSSSESGVNILSGFTFVLGFLLVFRMNQAYSRWWEGGTLLLQVRGQWFNAYSSLIALCNPAPEKALEVVKLQHLLARLMSLLYGAAILQVCTMERPSIQIIDTLGLNETHVKFLEDCHDKAEIVLQWVQKTIVSADADSTIKAAPPILSRVYNQLGNGMAILSNARKIGEFPIPFPVPQMISLMLQAQWLSTIVISTMMIKSSIWAAMLTFTTTLCLWSVNYLAIELEMPFGDDWNDLPLQHLQADMNASLAGLLHPSALKPPEFELPVTEQGNAHLDQSILAVQRDGSMKFESGGDSLHVDARPGSMVFAEGSSSLHLAGKTSSCLNYFTAPAKLGAESVHTAEHHFRPKFHNPRVVSGKYGTSVRGSSADASMRRMHHIRAVVKDIHKNSREGPSNNNSEKADVLRPLNEDGRSAADVELPVDQFLQGDGNHSSSDARHSDGRSPDLSILPSSNDILPQKEYAI